MGLRTAVVCDGRRLKDGLAAFAPPVSKYYPQYLCGVPDVEQVRRLAGRQEVLNVDDQRRLGEDVHRVRVTRALQRRARHVLEREQGLVDLGPWGSADLRLRRGQQLRDWVVEQDERQDGHNVGEHRFCPALRLELCPLS